MRKYSAVLIAVIVVAMAFGGSAGSNTAPSIKLSLMKYTPFPAEPGNYVTLTMKVENRGTGDADNVRLKILPDYPFFLDSNSTIKVENSATPMPIGSDMVVSIGKLPASEYTLIVFSVRTASDALEGSRQIDIWSQPNSGEAWTIEKFDVLVQGSDMLEISSVAPSILVPGRPQNVTFVLENSGTAMIRNVAFTWSEKDGSILPLGSGNKKYAASIEPHDSSEISFVLVADPGATSGAYALDANVTYLIGSNISKSLNVKVGMFIGGKGEFDVGIQDASSGSTSLFIANVGGTTTSSVSVSIPEQRNYVVSGTSSSFVGNMDPGDYMTATFSISQAGMLGNLSGVGGAGVLLVDVTYTDTNGNRETVRKEVVMHKSSAPSGTIRSSSQAVSFQGRNSDIIMVPGGAQASSGSMEVVAYVIAGLAAIAAFVLRKRIRGLLKGKKTESAKK